MLHPVIRYHLKIAFRYHPWRAIVVIIGSGLASGANNLLMPLIVAFIIDAIQHDRATMTGLAPALIAFAITHLWANVIGWRFNAYFLWTLENSLERRLFMIIHDRLMRHSLDFHSNRMSGELVSSATKFVRSFIDLWQMISLELVSTATVVIGSIIITFFIYPPLGLALFLASAAYVIAVWFGSKRLREKVQATNEAHSRAAGIMADDVSNIAAVKAFSSTQHEYERMDEATENLRRKSTEWMWQFIKVSTIYTLIMSGAAIAVAVLSVYAAEQHVIQLSLIYLAFTYALTIAQRLWNINSVFKTYYQVIGSSQNMLDILTLPVNIKDTEAAPELRVDHASVAFRSVNFQYEPHVSTVVLQDLNLIIPAGQKIGVVGHSGAGKTTLSKLLLRFIEPTSGQILIDDQDITEVTQDSLRAAIAYVPQEPLLFHRSLRDNIAYGKQDATDDEMIAAAKKAHAWEFIKDLPDQLDTIVGERGVKLSGGQRQRIAIARAIIKQAPILLLDEATSALDSESEKLIQESLNDLMTRSTTIAIAHRLSTLQKMHRIIVLDHGRLVEDGTHAELLEKNGIYASLWAHQSGGFIAE